MTNRTRAVLAAFMASLVAVLAVAIFESRSTTQHPVEKFALASSYGPTYATPAVLAAQSVGTITAGTQAWVVTPPGAWTYNTTCPSVCDGVAACVTAGGLDGGSGCWALNIGPITPISITCANNASTDGPLLQNALNAAAGVRGVYVVGTCAFATTTIVLPSNTVLDLAPSSSLTWALPLDHSVSHFGLYGHSAVDASVTATTLAATPTFGSNTISSNGAVSVGKWITITSATNLATVQNFQVTATSGTGPYALTLDSAIAFAFAAGDNITGVIPVQNVLIRGHGATIGGTGSIGIQCYGCVNIRVEDVVGTGSWDWGFGSFDYTTRDSVYESVHVSNAAGGGLGIEGCARCSILNPIILTAQTAGLVSEHTSGGIITNPLVSNVGNNGIGIEVYAVSGGGSGGVGSVGLHITGGVVSNCGQYGLLITDGSDVSVDGVTSRDNGVGFNFSSTQSGYGIYGSNLRAFNNTKSGYNFGSTGVMTLVNSYGVGNNSTSTSYASLVLGSGTLLLHNYTDISPVVANGASVLVQAGTLQADGLNLSTTLNQVWYGLQVTGASAKALLNDVVITGVAGQNHQGVVNGPGGSGGLVQLSNMRIVT